MEVWLKCRDKWCACYCENHKTGNSVILERKRRPLSCSLMWGWVRKRARMSPVSSGCAFFNSRRCPSDIFLTSQWQIRILFDHFCAQLIAACTFKNVEVHRQNGVHFRSLDYGKIVNTYGNFRTICSIGTPRTCESLVQNVTWYRATEYARINV